MANVSVTQSNVNLTIEEPDGSIINVSPSQVSTLSVVAEGPQGPMGPIGPMPEGALIVDQTAKVNGSVVYYDSTTSQFKADNLWTTSSLTDGGNF